jgi:hypothetical protein
LFSYMLCCIWCLWSVCFFVTLHGAVSAPCVCHWWIFKFMHFHWLVITFCTMSCLILKFKVPILFSLECSLLVLSCFSFVFVCFDCLQLHGYSYTIDHQVPFLLLIVCFFWLMSNFLFQFNVFCFYKDIVIEEMEGNKFIILCILLHD